MNSKYYIPILILASGGLLYFYFKNKDDKDNSIIEESVIEDTPKQSTPKQSTPKVSNVTTKYKSAFDPNFWKQLGKASIIKIDFAKKLSKQINNAVGFYFTDFTPIYDAFKQLKYQSQVSFLCDYYLKTYKVNLWKHIMLGKDFSIMPKTGIMEFDTTTSGLNPLQLQKIVDLVKKMPIGKLK